MKLDVFNHIFPKRFYDHAQVARRQGHASGRAIPAIVDRAPFSHHGYVRRLRAQVISLGSPPIAGPAPLSTELARLANDGMADS
jgi:hypothetical protein